MLHGTSSLSSGGHSCSVVSARSSELKGWRARPAVQRPVRPGCPAGWHGEAGVASCECSAAGPAVRGGQLLGCPGSPAPLSLYGMQRFQGCLPAGGAFLGSPPSRPPSHPPRLPAPTPPCPRQLEQVYTRRLLCPGAPAGPQLGRPRGHPPVELPGLGHPGWRPQPAAQPAGRAGELQPEGQGHVRRCAAGCTVARASLPAAPAHPPQPRDPHAPTSCLWEAADGCWAASVRTSASRSLEAEGCWSLEASGPGA